MKFIINSSFISKLNFKKILSSFLLFSLFSINTENPFENEIIINVPVAISIMNSGFLWPIDAWKEFTSGNLLASDDDVTISPR